ncbi:hypothetical protein [Pseudomonas helleri]|uniref:Morphogenetic protein n=1 Tax=Pseudomonas helleri TaxID=1608996 RepID=A0A6L5HN90_9PSED|nr:hypothetical protein [Pseudomonas helleri]MQU04842.1 hypothetical protein [Pseudomonas helleri]
MSEAIKERPILFLAPMVRAILEGRKTVTRRSVKATKAHANGFMMLDHGKGWRPYNAFGDFASDHEGMEYPIACPYGKPGDRLWARETCFINDYREASVPEQERANYDIHYRADGITDFEGEEELIRWRPSIHMPRWASRILLEVTDVRVERLQDITEEQALAEGIKKHSDGGYHVEDGKHYSDSLVESFACLWSSVGGDWDANPWVWCVSFKRIT